MERTDGRKGKEGRNLMGGWGLVCFSVLFNEYFMIMDVVAEWSTDIAGRRRTSSVRSGGEEGEEHTEFALLLLLFLK